MWWQPHNRHGDGDGHGYVSGYGDGDGYGAGAWAGDGVHGGGGGMRVLAICMGICMGMVMSMGQTGPIQGRRRKDEGLLWCRGPVALVILGSPK